MGNMKGPGLFLAQFAGDKPPFDSLESISEWAASLGYEGVQIPTFDARIFDLERAANSQDYCDEIKGICSEAGVEITELSTHLQGQLVAVHPAYDLPFDGFAPSRVHGKPKERREWAANQIELAAIASRRMGLETMVSFTGALAFPYLYPWPPRASGLIDEAFSELARRWKPLLDACDDQGVDVGFELHPGQGLRS